LGKFWLFTTAEKFTVTLPEGGGDLKLTAPGAEISGFVCKLSRGLLRVGRGGD
jgi:hypothetical protein